ncbi:MAG: DUF2336 domain-containing protein [Alphaproteobacteria bacterium]|nr:DUF2336 domain-containing protein [Alphaproteobacteria bacterium]
MTDGSYGDDYQALLEMARDKTAAGRSLLANAMGDFFSQSNDVLTDHERTLMSGILRSLLHTAEMSVRRKLANQLAALDNVPHELIVTLANDEIEVAYPILVKSKLLYDTDLIEIIRHRTLQHQLSIAMHRALSEGVSDALVENGDEDVIKTLLENTNARIAKSTMEYLVEQSKRVDSFQNPILRRPDLDRELAKRMYWWVSAALKIYVAEHFDIDPMELDEALDTTVAEIMHHESEADVNVSRAGKLAQLLKEAGWITSETMIRVLRQGEIPLFEAMFAKHLGLRPRLLQRFLVEPGGEALAVACKGIGMVKDDFATIFMRTRKARFGKPVINTSELTRVLELFDRVHLEPAQAMLAKWRRDPDYLNALRTLEKPVPDSRSDSEAS